MKTAISMFFLAAVGLLRPAVGESAWTYVPASRETRSLEAFAVAEPPSEKVVTLVGMDPKVLPLNLEPPRVFAVDIPAPSGEPGGPPLPGASRAGPIPEGARWPDASGRIVAAPSPSRDKTGAAGIRNPWEVRVHPVPVGVETAFLCGGIIAGGEGGPIAIVNGHVVRQGDTLGRFGVARVIADGVLLQRDGSYFVIPLGRRTIVSTTDG